MKVKIIRTLFIFIFLSSINWLGIIESRADLPLNEEIITLQSFDAWWGKKGKDCKVKISQKTSSQPATLQVDEGLAIVKEQVVEILFLKISQGTFRPSIYKYKILYKDENSKVSLAEIIFANKRESIKFGKALKNFGLS
tara:strand:+ start:96 stop:512 length:417 start_codon:yes stop_codon:yes gene_type:complete